MHRTRIALVGSLLLIGLSFAFFWPSKKRDVGETTRVQQNPLQTTNSVETTIKNLPLPAAAKNTLERLELLKLNEQPIEYFGRLLDQSDNPVAEATVNFLVTRGLPPHESFVRGSVTSDLNGRFEISGYIGAELGLQPVKSGYSIASTNLWPIFSKMRPTLQYHPSRNNPTIIKMWKSEGAASLLAIDQQYEIPADGKAVTVDLVGQRLSDSGDLRVSVYRGADSPTKPWQFDWNYSLEAVDGKIKEIPNSELRITFAAPVSGYSKSIIQRFPHDDGVWFMLDSKAIILSSRNGGVYAKFLCDIGIHNDGTASVRLTHGVTNTNGVPNLEDAASQSAARE